MYLFNGVQFIQHYMIKVVSDLRQVGGFLLIPPLLTMTSISLKYFLKMALSTLNLTLKMHTNKCQTVF